MQIIDSDRWKKIKAPGQRNAFTKIRAIADHPLDFLIGKDHERRFIFIFECASVSNENFNLPKVTGIKIVFNAVENSKSQLVLILLDTEQFEIFRVLCCDLIDATRQFQTDNDAANIAKSFGEDPPTWSAKGFSLILNDKSIFLSPLSIASDTFI